jgi:transcriptional regulator with XRE-family HTH domain
MDFASVFQEARERADLTQAEVAERSGIARPNIAAYEAGRREPKASTIERLLEAVGYRLSVEPLIEWTWTNTLRPYPVPSTLWRLPTHRAFRTITTSTHIWWSGPPRTFDLSDRKQRLRAYEIVLREGGPDDIESIVDGLLLTESFDELVLPRPLSAAWMPLIDRQTAIARPAA